MTRKHNELPVHAKNDVSFTVTELIRQISISDTLIFFEESYLNNMTPTVNLRSVNPKTAPMNFPFTSKLNFVQRFRMFV